MAMPKPSIVSVIMPVYNAEEYVASAISSVLSQTHTALELIIINDGSTDESLDRINLFSDSRILLISQPNGGVAAARNAGLRKMTGDYFCFCDADDILPPLSIESRLKIFEKNNSIRFVDGRVKEVDERLNKIIRDFLPSFRGNPFREMLHISESCYLGQTWMIKANKGETYVMESRLSQGEDFFFFLSLARQGGIYDYTEEIILLYRRHHKSASKNIEGLNKSYLLIFQEIRKWEDVGPLDRLFFYLKTRKIMFLSFLFDSHSPLKAIKSLFQWR